MQVANFNSVKELGLLVWVVLGDQALAFKKAIK
jgi:hypothetical protein